MPIVPRLNPQVRSQSTQLPTDYARSATPAAFGALTGQAMSGFGNDLNNLSQEAGDIVIKRNMENIQRYAKQSASEYDAFKNNLLAGDGTDKNPGVMNLSGETAIQAYNPTIDALKKKRDEIASRTDNHFINDAFNAYADQADSSTHEQLGMHVAHQRLVANKDASDGRIESAMSDAALAWRDDNTYNKSYITVNEEIRQQGETLGLSKEAIDNNVKRGISQLAKSRIEAGAAFDTNGANAIFQKYSDDMDGVTRSKVADLLDRKHKQDINDMWSQEEHQHIERNQRQGDYYTKMTAGVMGGSVADFDIQQAADKNLINGEQAQQLHNFLVNPRGSGDPAEENRLAIGLIRGNLSLDDVAKNPAINEDERKYLIGLSTGVTNRGGNMGREDVKFVMAQIEANFRQGKSILAGLDEDTNYRMGKAMKQAYDAVTSVTGDKITPAFLNAVQDGAITTWGPGSVESPTSMLNKLPLPQTWKGPRYGTRENMVSQLDEAKKGLLDFYNQGKVSEKALLLETEKIRAMADQIQRLPTAAEAAAAAKAAKH